MIKGLYSAASAMLANLTRQNTLAHNISNLNTPGFKQVMVSLDDFVETGVVTPPGPVDGTQQLQWVGSLGLGVESTPEETDFTAGGMKLTGQPLDLAIQGPGFFRIMTPNGERYTRDGRFQRDVAGSLVTIDGYQVLDNSGQPIKLTEGELSIAGDGTLLANGKPAGQLGLAAFNNPAQELQRDLPNTFRAASAPTAASAPSAAGALSGTQKGTVQQGYLEMSNTNPAQLMTQMVAVSRAYEAAQQMVATQDELVGKTISSLSRL